jgi:glycosyltransferase involved in cell wall biosynthesis
VTPGPADSSATLPPPRVALVHDFLLDLRGAERVLASLCDLYPTADVFTAVYDEAGTDRRFADRTINTSFLQALHPTSRTFRTLLPLYPSAVQGLDLRGYDLVISSSSAWAHGVRVDAGATHVCYCHNPFRYAWDTERAALAGRDPVSRAVLRLIFAQWRRWDRAAAQRVDRFVANSAVTRQRVAECFGRDAEVIHPPVDVGRFTPGPVGDYYMVLSELMPHKRIGIAIEAANALRLPLLVVGDGPATDRLRRLAGPSVSFLGRVTDGRAAELLSGARALIVTATEEFGIAAVEAQAAGRPVVAFARGGVLETVIDGVTGALFPRPDAASLAETLKSFDPLAVDPVRCVANARRFDVPRFHRELAAAVSDAVAACAGRTPSPGFEDRPANPDRLGVG